MTDAGALDEMTEVPPGATMVHPPHGFVKLVQVNADDLMVVNAARVSFRKQSEWVSEEKMSSHGGPVKRLDESDQKVLEFLMRNHHGTPFEHTFFQFHVRAPIFVFREWHRHRIGISINEESARYVPLKPDFYVPDAEHCRKQVGKPGRYKFEQMQPGEAQSMCEAMETSYATSFAIYEAMMREGVAKEIARAVLPVGIYSQMLWTCNARSLMAFLNLRNADTALREIKDYAQAMEDIFAEHMPVTHKAFIEVGRMAP